MYVHTYQMVLTGRICSCPPTACQQKIAANCQSRYIDGVYPKLKHPQTGARVVIFERSSKQDLKKSVSEMSESICIVLGIMREEAC